jgi:hypothetical protein
MKHPYDDIRSRIAEAPAWFDQSGVPRYGAFVPRQSPNIYAEQVCLMEIACQRCEKRFRVELSSTFELSKGRLDQAIRNRDLRYGDPPNHRCSGDSMTSIPLRVLEFWRKPAPGEEFERVRDLEIDVKPEGEEET